MIEEHNTASNSESYNEDSSKVPDAVQQYFLIQEKRKRKDRIFLWIIGILILLDIVFFDEVIAIYIGIVLLIVWAMWQYRITRIFNIFKKMYNDAEKSLDNEHEKTKSDKNL